MNRRRTKLTTPRYTDSDGSSALMLTVPYSDLQDCLPGPGACQHVKSSLINIDTTYRHPTPNGKPFSYRVSAASSFSWEYDTIVYPMTVINSAIREQLNTFDWEKLPTSSGFQIIQFFAELDDTLAMFSMKFLKELSYGSFTWGVMPFVSDVKALLNTLKNLSARLDDIAYETKHAIKIPEFTYGNSNWNYRYDVQQCTITRTGKLDMSFQDDVSVLLDRLGFHPSAATIWDLLPMSFVVDYFIPIGDLLDSLHPPGWVQAVIFSGWLTVKVKYSWRHHNNDWAPDYGGTVTCFSRFHNNNVLTVERKGVDWKLPTYRQLFNSLYVAKGIKR